MDRIDSARTPKVKNELFGEFMNQVKDKASDLRKQIE